jgi:phage repressor protein C with HTH and peptisase S24 domain
VEASDPRSALRALIDRSGASYAGLSRLLGRNAAYLQQFVMRGSPRRLAEQDRRRLAAYFGVDEAVLGGETAPARSAITIPRLDVAAAAGPGALVDAERSIGGIGIDPRLIATLGGRVADLSLIRAAGGSMEPTIADGDELLVDRGDRAIGRGGVHVVRLDGALLVKRVTRIAEGYRVASDNPEFPAIDVATLDVIGRVVWLSRTLR